MVRVNGKYPCFTLNVIMIHFFLVKWRKPLKVKDSCYHWMECELQSRTKVVGKVVQLNSTSAAFHPASLNVQYK